MKVDILILNYNGKDLMKEYLPSICNAAEGSKHECRVHVVDNLSSDGSAELLNEKFPDVKVHIASENRVLCSYNEVVEGLDSDIVIFLNNDMKVEPDFVDLLVDYFTDKEVMFVAPRLINFDGTYNGGRSRIDFKYGVIKMVVEEDLAEEYGRTQAISTGAFRRSAFLDMGGFDELYLPGIWEDVDLCFRGMKRGWKGLYEPSSVIWHDESTTFNREYGKKKKLILAHRNMFLFLWRNIRDRGMLAEHIFFLPLRIVYSFLSGKSEMAQGFFSALKKLPEALDKRAQDRAVRNIEKVKDRDLVV